MSAGTDWDALFAELRRHVEPLLEAGWTVTDTHVDSEYPWGDSVLWDLARNGEEIELEWYAYGDLVCWPLYDEDPEHPDDATFWLVETDPEECRRQFEEMGWLDRPEA